MPVENSSTVHFQDQLVCLFSSHQESVLCSTHTLALWTGVLEVFFPIQYSIIIIILPGVSDTGLIPMLQVCENSTYNTADFNFDAISTVDSST